MYANFASRFTAFKFSGASLNAEDIRNTCKRIADIGYRALQLDRLLPLPADELLDICEDEGLDIVSLHADAATIVEDPQQIIAALQGLSCTHVSYPQPHVPVTTLAEVHALAEMLETAGETYRAAGMTLSYHNHAIEFRRFGEKTILEILLETIDPRHCEMALDLYWVQQGGGSPSSWLRKVRGRQRLVHVKDYGVPADAIAGAMCDVGSGNLDWGTLLPLLDVCGTRHVIVEVPDEAADPFVSAAQSFNYLNDVLPL